jgi:subtilisin family serine protease
MKDQIGEVYETALQGFTAELTADQVKELGADPAVKYIEENQIITLSKDEAMKSAPVVTKLTDAVPWGVARVGGGDKEYKGKNAAWIIDTGIDFSHPDLNVGTEDAKSFVPHEESPQDVRGHGTMVAGIIGAIKGNGGILGVAPGVKVIPVKIFRADGYSDLEIVIAAINYVAEEASSGDVANLSFSLVPYTDEQGIYHDGTSQALDDAVLDASSSKKKSIDFTIAAGNDYDNAGLRSPARVNGEHIYTVSAMSQKDLWAPWSNFGNPPIDYCAPGVDIASTWPYDVAKDPLDPNIIPGYNIRSGTSFAAPHVAGLLLLGKIKDGGHVIGDPDGNPDIIAVNKK